MDPAKLKVVELRAELTKRGLDSKGNKPVLVERLKQALAEEKPGAAAGKPGILTSSLFTFEQRVRCFAALRDVYTYINDDRAACPACNARLFRERRI